MPAIIGGAFKTIEVALTTNVASFAAEMGAQAATVVSFGSTVEAAAARGNIAAKNLGGAFMAAGAAIDAALALSADKAVNFQEQMAKVNTIANESDGALKAQGSAVLDLATKYATSTSTLTAALYQVEQEGFRGADAMHVLDVSTKASVGTQTDLQTQVQATSALLKIYGASANEAQHYSDILVKAIETGGKISFPAFNQAIGQVAPVAAQLHVPFEQAAAALSTLTKENVDAGTAGTGLARIFKTLLDGKGEIANFYKDIGVASGEQAIAQNGLAGTMELLTQKYANNAEGLRALFPDQRTFRIAVDLAAQGGKNFQEQLDAMNGSAGASDRAFKTMSESVGFQFKQLKESVSVLAIEFGSVLLPILGPVIRGFTDIAKMIGGLNEPTKILVGVLALLAGAALTVGGAFLFFAPKIAAAQALWATMVTGTPAVVAAQGAVTVATEANAKALEELSVAQEAWNTAAQPTIVELQALAVAQANATAAGEALTAAEAAATDATFSLTGALTTMLGVVVAIAAPLAVAFEANRIANFFENIKLGGTHIKALTTDLKELGSASTATQAELDKVASVANLDRTSLSTNIRNLFSFSAGESSNRANADYTTRLQDIDKALANIVDSGHADQARVAMERIAAALGMSPDQLITHLGNYKTAVDAANAASADATNKNIEMAASQQASTLATDEQTAAMQAAADTAETYKKKVSDLSSAIASFTSAPKILSEAAQADTSGGSTGNDGYKAQDEQIKRSEDLARARDNQVKAAYDLQKAEEALTTAQNKNYNLEILQLQLSKDRNALDQAKNLLTIADAEDHLARVRAAGGSQRAIIEAEQAITDARLKQQELGAAGQDIGAKLTDAQSGAAQQRAVTDAQEAVREAHVRVTEAANAEADAERKMSEPLTAVSGASAKASVSLQDYASNLAKQNQAQQDWQKDLFTIIQRGAPQEVVDQLVKMGADGAGIVHQFATSNKTDFDNFVQQMTESGTSAGTGFAQELDAGLQVAQFLAHGTALSTVQGITDAFNALPGVVHMTAEQMAKTMQEFGIQIDLIPNTTGLIPNLGIVDQGKTPTYGANADGGFYVSAFAGGGMTENHSAQIARGTRIWAEPETGGEAYIPLSLAKRDQSMKILAMVADQFGLTMFDAVRGGSTRYAAGGIDYLPSGMGGRAPGSVGAASAPIIAPVSQTSNYNFGDIQGVTLEDAERYARRKKALANMASGSGLTLVG